MAKLITTENCYKKIMEMCRFGDKARFLAYPQGLFMVVSN